MDFNPDMAINSAQRIACLLLLDTSGSMHGSRIKSLNQGVQTLLEALKKDDIARQSADLAILTFDSAVTLVQDFHTVDNWEQLLELEASGGTSLGKAIVEGLEIIENRKDEYRANGIPYYRPWMFILTDGVATDSTEEAAMMLRASQNDNKVKVFPIGVGNGVDYQGLAELTQADPIKLDESKWEDLFIWLSASLSVVSSSNIQDVEDGQVALPTPEFGTWGAA